MNSNKAKQRTKSPSRKPTRRHSGTAIPNSSPARDDLSKKQKVAAITKAINADPIDIVTLRQLAISRGGLVNNELRRKAWPKLLNVNVFNIPKKPSTKTLHEHRDYQQVVLDVNRSLKRFPPGMKEDQRMSLQDQMVDVIMRVLVYHQDLHYYQGYHDICVTFLLVVGEDITFAIMEKLSTNHLRDFMDKNMDKTNHQLNYLYPIVGKASPELRSFMERSEVGTIFSLSWLITWYGHVLNEFRHIVRLYDFFIACHPLMPIYLAASIVLYREQEVLATECEMCMVHSLLSHIPEDLPFEHLVSKAGDLFVQYPPEELANEARLQYRQSVSIKNYKKFEQTAKEQRPDNVLKQQKGKGNKGKDEDTSGSMLVKLSVWGLTAALSAAAFAVLNTASEWQWF